MHRFVVILMAVWACGGAEPTPSVTVAVAVADPDDGPPRAVRGLVEQQRYARLAVPIGAALDGQRWMGAVDHDLVAYDGEREVRRLPNLGARDLLRALPDGGWIAGARLLAADGTVRFDGYRWAHRYGRFGSPKAFGFSDDGRVAILDGADSPSTCLCDKARGRPGGSGGALVRLTFTSEAAPIERVLIEHDDRRDFTVAASSRWVAAVDRRALSVWPATGDDPPITATIDGPVLDRLVWASDRYLIATRYLELDLAEVLVLDREAGFAPTATWQVDGLIRDLALRPGTAELAVALTRYRATDVVHVDERRVEVYGLDGTRHARLDTRGYPASLAWSPRGDTLLVATTGQTPAEQAVIRYAAK